MCLHAVVSDAHLPGSALFSSTWQPSRRALLIWRQSQEEVPWWGNTHLSGCGLWRGWSAAPCWA